MKISLKRSLIVISTIFLIILMIYYVDFQKIQENIIKISIYGVFSICIVYSFSFILRSFRLKQIFKGIELNASIITLYGSFGIGWGINEITPGKIGDLARIEIIRQKEDQISLSKSFCAITIERYIDVLILFIFTCLIMIYLFFLGIRGTTKLNLSIYILLGALILITGIMCLIVLLIRKEFILNIIGKISINLKQRLEIFINKFLEGMKDFKRNQKEFLSVIIVSIPIWILDSSTIVILFYLIGYEINVFIILLAQIFSFFTKTFPITPGGWVISENAGALLVFLFYPSISYFIILSIFILDHIIRIAYIFIYGTFSSIGLNIKYRKINIREIEKEN